jgi:hypothetical protein
MPGAARARATTGIRRSASSVPKKPAAEHDGSAAGEQCRTRPAQTGAHRAAVQHDAGRSRDRDDSGDGDRPQNLRPLLPDRARLGARRRPLEPVGDPRPLTGAKKVHRPDGPPRRDHPKALSQRLRELEDAGIVAADREPARWHFRLDGADYLVESDGRQWSLTTGAPPARADVTITATTRGLTAHIFAGSTPASTSPAKPGQSSDSDG